MKLRGTEGRWEWDGSSFEEEKERKFSNKIIINNSGFLQQKRYDNVNVNRSKNKQIFQKILFYSQPIPKCFKISPHNT